MLTTARSFPWSAVTVPLMVALLIWLVAGYDRPADAAAEIGSLIRCPVCQGVPIAESPAPMAVDMMAVLREELETGATRREAIDAVLGAYPGSLLLEPDVTGSTIALWLVPAAALLVGAGLTLTVRRTRIGAEAVAERAEMERRLRHVKTDLAELSTQVATGEVPAEAASHLRHAYQEELAETEKAIQTSTALPASPLPRSRRRVVLGVVVVMASLAAVVGAAGAFLVDRPQAVSGVAGLDGDPAGYSNETLAAVIAANIDHPQIDGMRLALAERHFETGDYQTAFPYYLDVASSDNASDTQAATALTRLGWMAYEGNGEVATALELLSEARLLSPDDPFPVYLTGIVTWCGEGDGATATGFFRQVLTKDLGDSGIRSAVEEDLAAAEAGEACPDA